MKANNPIRDKSFAFALKIVECYKTLRRENREYILSKQLLRSGTSIGANIEEALGGQSRKDFYSKLTIAYKEARETHYWLKILMASNYLKLENGMPLLDDVTELLKILGSIQKTIRNS